MADVHTKQLFFSTDSINRRLTACLCHLLVCEIHIVYNDTLHFSFKAI